MFPGAPTLTLLIGTGLAHAGWTETDREHGCIFFRGETEASGATAVRVECEWDVDPAALRAVLGSPGGHRTIFASLKDSETLSGAGGVERVRQVHHAAGASDREVVVEVTTHDIPGGQRYAWTKSHDQSGRRTDGVEPELTDGFWEVTDHAGGVRLVYETRYLAGGSVPAFLVRWFQGAGIKAVIGDLRAHMDRAR